MLPSIFTWTFTSALAAVLLGGCAAFAPEPEEEPGFGLSERELAAAVDALALEPGARILVAAGDIARCERLQPAAETADLVAAIIDAAASALVITLGDHAYESGTRREFEDCYEPTWGRFNDITRPTPGNHDFESDEGIPYYEFFPFYRENEEARRRGYYAFTFGDWRVLALNSLLPMAEGSAQMRWLEAELRSAGAECVLAYWHHPLFSSGRHGITPWDTGEQSVTAWRILFRFGADAILNGHEHFYERFEPQTAAGDAAPGGIRQFIVGTGGAELRSAIRREDNSVFFYNGGYGVLVLALEEDRYRWAFVGTDGVIHDRSRGDVTCHTG